jgi:tellurite resistance protein TerC
MPVLGLIGGFLEATALGTPVWLWTAFLCIVLLLLVFDLGVLHRKAHAIGVRESLLMAGFYVTLGLLFGVWVWFQLGHEKAMEYWTGFVVEQSLSMDNVFVIALILGTFAIPRERQHRVLFWGILGVIVLRGIMITVGATAVERFHWILYVFAAFLVFTGIKLLFSKDDDHGFQENMVLRLIRGRLRVTDGLRGDRFFIREPDVKTGRMALHATPLFVALVFVEFADVLFAVDSVPAVFAITTDPFIVYTSNIFAILGLRSLFFALSALLERFAYLKYALSALLVFIGAKVFVADFIGKPLFGWEKFPPAVSLGATIVILAVGFTYSVWRTRPGAQKKLEEAAAE